MRAPQGVYFGEFAQTYGPKATSVRFVATGEFREPKAGEHYLSGAEITAYIAKNTLSTKYWIAKAVRMVTCPCCKGTGKTIDVGGN
jgi:hypothetical protein